MAKSKVSIEMRKHAEAAAEMVFSEIGITMDFGESTIGTVQAILNNFWKEGDLEQSLEANLALLFGAYIGELIITAFPDAKWVRRASGITKPESPFILLEDIKLFPIRWCHKQLANGPVDNVGTKYLEFRKVIDARNSQN